MDTRTGKTYPSFDAALNAGVPANNIALRDGSGRYVVPNGPFKGRVYRLNARGQSVRDREAELAIVQSVRDREAEQARSESHSEGGR